MECCQRDLVEDERGQETGDEGESDSAHARRYANRGPSRLREPSPAGEKVAEGRMRGGIKNFEVQSVRCRPSPGASRHPLPRERGCYLLWYFTRSAKSGATRLSTGA